MIDETIEPDSAPRLQDAAARDNAVMLGALCILAYAASMMTHEALGHGGYCVAHGGHNVMLAPWGERCDLQLFGIEAAGPLAQFGAGLLSWLALRFLPGRLANLRCFLWLFMVFNLLASSGYVAFSGATDFGDAAVLIRGLEPFLVWRGALFLLGAALYYGSMWAAAFELRRFAGSDNEGARLNRLVWIPYLTAGVLACCAGALNTTMPPGLALKLAVASSFGAGLGMLRLPDLQRGIAMRTPMPATYVNWSFLWAIAAALTATIFMMVLGPGLA